MKSHTPTIKLDSDLVKESGMLDKYIILMLYFGCSISATARALNVSRETVYQARNRGKGLLLRYGLLDISKEKE